MTVIMYLDGYKTLSHIKVLEYVSQKYNILSNNQVQTIDTLRKFRHGIVYYGKKVSNEYLINHQEEITEIIKSLDNLVESKLENNNLIYKPGIWCAKDTTSNKKIFTLSPSFKAKLASL